MAFLLSIISQVFIRVITFYQRYISILILPHCRFYPTCSYYAIDSLRNFGLVKGLYLIFKRVLKCHPLHSGGIDTVPIRIKKDKREF